MQSMAAWNAAELYVPGGRSAVTWFDHHHRSNALAVTAQTSLRRGDNAAARQLYTHAAEEAEQALSLLSRDKHVTRWVVAMFAAKWWRRAHRADDAARIARMIGEAPELFAVTVTPLDTAAPRRVPLNRS